jgi:hypothetical protein
MKKVQYTQKEIQEAFQKWVNTEEFYERKVAWNFYVDKRDGLELGTAERGDNDRPVANLAPRLPALHF